MDGAFACPECGCEIRLRGYSPGRRVRCDWCSTWVEVPFIPRAPQALRRYRSDRGWSLRRWWRTFPAWARFGFVVLSLAIAASLTVRQVRHRWKSSEVGSVARLVASSERLERGGRLGNALAEMEAALALAARIEPPPDELPGWRERRDALAYREARSRLDALAIDGDPGRAVGEALTLQARLVRDRALGPLEPAIGAALDLHRERWAQADSADARRAYEAGDAPRAMELCERQYRTAADLGPVPRRRLQDDATALARRLIGDRGALIEPVRGEFTLGSPETYATLLRPPLAEALKQHGYLPRPPRAEWDALWSELAPYRLSVKVQERQTETYFESPNRVSRVDAHLQLDHAGTPLWEQAPWAVTEKPVPGLPAYLAGRVAASPRRSPEFERLLYENARAQMIEKLIARLHNLPACPSPPPAPRSSSDSAHGGLVPPPSPTPRPSAVGAIAPV